MQHSVYSGGDNGVSVEHYRYQGGEHVWFDATYQGQNASELSGTLFLAMILMDYDDVWLF